MSPINFSAGPSILPKQVLLEASKALLDFENHLSLIEVSHRGDTFKQIMENTQQLVKELFQLDENKHVLFLQGGASSQFYMVPFNLLEKNEKAAYVDTGTWASKAIKEAQYFGQIDTISSSKEKNYREIPLIPKVNHTYKYLHITTNNTIYGTQYSQIPSTNIPLIADMSSDIFSKKININSFGLVYAGAQKNLGAAGTTMVIIDKRILKKNKGTIPSMIDYHTHIEKKSMFNTPPVFSIYVCYLNLLWLQKQGGINAIEQINRQKATLLYQEIDRNQLLTAYVKNNNSRSIMNVTFDVVNQSQSNELDLLLKEANIYGLRGHRTVGGYRASIYNAMPMKGVETLVEVLKAFERKFG